MPKSYTEKEKATIIAELKQVAMESMLQKGIKKTTVDELVRKVHIPKGTFYLFYESKEMLLYDAFMQIDVEMHQQLSQKLLEMKNNVSIDSLTDLLHNFFQRGLSIGILPLMISGELDILMRKLPDDIVADHISKDDDFLVLFCTLFPNISADRLKDYSASFRAIFFTAAYQREIGENYDRALKMMIKGLVIQMWEESK